MKAEIDSTGTLTIVPETELERFALSCWWDKYTSEPCDAVLHIELIADHSSAVPE